jgi:hypothetical protein
MRDDQGMSIDPVAVYAAVVATGALGWQVYQWRYERKGKLRLGIMATTCDGMVTIQVMIANPNAYAVRLEHVAVCAMPADDSFDLADKDLVFGRRVKAAEARLPAIEVPEHDSLRWTWEQQDLDALFPGMRFLPGGEVKLFVATTLGFGYESELVTVERQDAEHMLFAGVKLENLFRHSRSLRLLRGLLIWRGRWPEADQESHDQTATMQDPGHEKI